MIRPPRFRSRRRAAAAAAALAWLAAGCGGPGEPVATLGVAPAEVVLPYAGTAALTLTWTPSAPLERPTVFVHLLGPEGGVLRTFDHAYPGDWRPGAEVSYPLELWQSALGPPLPAGSYELTVGVYDPDGRRPPLVAPGREVDDGEYAVARVEAPPAPAGGARLVFGDGWEPPAPDGDRQHLGARWLGDGGVLEVAGIDAPLDLALTVWVPAAAEIGHTLVLDPEVEEPAVEIASPCLDAPVRAAGTGSHELTLALGPAAGEASCALHFDTDYIYLDPRTLHRLSLLLRRVVWAAAAEPPPEAATAP